MNVAYLSNSSQIGGGEKCMESLFQGLKGTGIEPFVICPDQGPFVAMLEKMGVRVFIRDLASPSLAKPWGTVRDFRWLRRFLREHDIALFHANGSMGGRKATLACRATGTPLICHIHYPLPLDYYRWVYRRLPAPDSVVFVCDALQRDLGEVLKGAYPGTRQEVVYNGIDTGVYAPKDVDNKVPRIGIIANLQAVKGHEDFLDMASLLVKAGYDASFELIGGDVQNQGRKAVLENRARELGILDKVKFWGFVGDVIGILQDLDIIVCSSHEEASPRCIIESMSCRKPIVATRVNGIPDVVEDGVTGLLAPAHEPASLFGAVKRLLDDPSLRRSLGYGGWKKVNERYSLQAYTGQIVSLYGQALKRKQGSEAGQPAKAAA